MQLATEWLILTGKEKPALSFVIYPVYFSCALNFFFFYRTLKKINCVALTFTFNGKLCHGKKLVSYK